LQRQKPPIGKRYSAPTHVSWITDRRSRKAAFQYIAIYQLVKKLPIFRIFNEH